ncbi:MAG: hypothetical protein HFH63_01540 [Lachnospiraceae bacterium]|nr:hypothetical protein [Lachnospiraceae bacterium]
MKQLSTSKNILSKYKNFTRLVLKNVVYFKIDLKLDLSNVRPQFTINFPDGFDDYYLIEQEVDLSKLKLQETEVQRVKWAG